MVAGTQTGFTPSKVPTSIEETVLSAETLMKAGHWGQAVELLTLNLEKEPEHAPSLNTLGLCFYRLKNYDEAVATFDRLVEIAPQQFSFQLNKSLVLLKLDRLEEARGILKQVLTQNPDHQRANAIMGLVLEQLGEYPQAMAHYERGREENRLSYLREISLRPPTLPPNRHESESQDEGPADAPHLATSSDAEAAEEAPPPALPGSLEASDAEGFEDPERTAPELMAPALPSTPPREEAPNYEPEMLSERPNAIHVPSWAKKLDDVSAAQDFPEDLSQITRLAKDLLLFPVQGEAYVRLATASATIGALRSQRVMRLYDGQESTTRLGGASPITRMLGNGAAVLFTGEAVSSVLHLQDDALFLMEDTLLAFSAGLAWENHTLSGPNFDVDFLKLTGSGTATVAASRDWLAIPVTEKIPVQAHASQVVGWTGDVMPTLSPFSIEPEEDAAAILFEGAGHVWVLADLSS